MQFTALLLLLSASLFAAQRNQIIRTPIQRNDEYQPLSENVRRLLKTMRDLGAPPVPWETEIKLNRAVFNRLGVEIQDLLDPAALVQVEINPEGRVKAVKGQAPAVLQQGAFLPFVIKVVNESAAGGTFSMSSPQSGPVYAGMTPLSAQRMQRTELKETLEKTADTNRFLVTEIQSRDPMSDELRAKQTQYFLGMIYSSEAGSREVTLSFGLAEQKDPGFRGEVPVLFEIRPAIPVKLRIEDFDGRPTTARLTFVDQSQQHIWPPQSKRLAPDFYFQPQIYRADRETVFLPPGRHFVRSTRGPEYHTTHDSFMVPTKGATIYTVKLRRWINPADYGFYSGDHHIHGAGCAHYTSPTEGVKPEDMFRQVKGEGLNVGCILTWGPCFDYQRQFFAPVTSPLSEPFTLLKYDLEISGFGSEALGHVCLLNLTNQNFPGSDGTKSKGWPTWTTPVMRWAKAQGAVTGYAHSGSGLEINAEQATARLLEKYDGNKDQLLTEAECKLALLPLNFREIDQDRDRALTKSELSHAHDKAAEQLPNLAIPQMNGVGAMEIPVSVVTGVCDFISTMDTPRIAEWNMWYHLLNCGFPLKVSGETDFPCMSGERVGQGRVYVQLGKVDKVDFGAWCKGLGEGRSYVSDGFAHPLEFVVHDKKPGEGTLHLTGPAKIKVRAKVAFAFETAMTVAQGTVTPPDGKKWLGDTVTLHQSRTNAMTRGGSRLVEVIINGKTVAKQEVPADGRVHDLDFKIDVNESGWVALRHFPEFHTNPVEVLVSEKPIRASRQSALWCMEVIEQLWKNREKNIAADERPRARIAFDKAIARFRQIAAESAN